VALCGLSLPSFWLGILMIMGFSIAIPVLPSSGHVPFLQDPLEALRHLALPALTLVAALAAATMRMTRAAMIEILSADYVRTARAKGLTRLEAISRHALRTSFIPVAQSIAFQLPGIFVGTFIIETVFAWQGLGRWTLDAIMVTQSVNVAVAGVAFGGLMFAIGAILADLSVAIVDPRARVS